MVYCFVPDCKHSFESHKCTFFTFPSKEKKKEEYKRWIRLIRRQDREPGPHSRVCSCHFRNGDKRNGPEINERNKNIFCLFNSDDEPPRKQKKKATSPLKENQINIKEMVEKYHQEQSSSTSTSTETINPTAVETTAKVNVVILQAENEMLKRELNKYKTMASYHRAHYSVSSLSEDVVRMETGLPTKAAFDIVVETVADFKDDINYFAGWKVDCIILEDQVFLTLMKFRQNYTNLHLAQLFSCSIATISNVILTFLHVLHELFFKDIMVGTIPSREKNKKSAPSSFSEFNSCRIVIDCTDVECATPGLMSEQNATYSQYRGMNSFKALVGVAPNGVITFVSDLFPGSVSDKEIVVQSKLLDSMDTGDLILADKGFLIQDIVPKGVYVNIPPFLEHGKFTESEVKATKSIARCRIHVERANARLKDFKILSFIPSYLRGYVNNVFQVCAALVNLQNPLIKECSDTLEFE